MLFKVCSLVLILSMSIQEAWSETSRSDTQWQTLQSTLGAGERVRIRPVKGKTVEGSVAMVTDDALTATTRDGVFTIPRPEIREVKVKSESQQRQNALFAAAIGGLAGVSTAVILDGALTDGNGVSGAAAVFLGAIGALSGAFVGLFRPPYRTIYKAR